jgi:hypothetical protein
VAAGGLAGVVVACGGKVEAGGAPGLVNKATSDSGPTRGFLNAPRCSEPRSSELGREIIALSGPN